MSGNSTKIILQTFKHKSIFDKKLPKRLNKRLSILTNLKKICVNTEAEGHDPPLQFLKL